MTAPTSASLALACDLIARRSVTPRDAGCQSLLGRRLAAAGFRVESLPFGEVSNLWARRGREPPLFLFAGHTDVVPPGPLEAWTSPPFEPSLRGEFLYGRGAADMKGSLAAMVLACERFVADHPRHPGSLALLLTSDEEGPAVDGTARVIEALRERGEIATWCVVGEPSSRDRLGDVIKIGRRGSLGGQLRVRGHQGHVAYPHLADNPIHRATPALAELAATTWDNGNEDFPPTSFQISNLQSGTGAENVIPGELEAWFNFRFSTAVGEQALRERTEAILARHALDYELTWMCRGEPFVTSRGALIEAVIGAIHDCTGLDTRCSTEGGTSDGRFIAPTGAEVVELGPVNATIHKIDECVRIADLDHLVHIYERTLERLLLPDRTGR